MTIQEFEQVFYRILTEKFDKGANDLDMEVTFRNLGIDSLDMAELIVDFEKVFGLAIADEDAEKINNIAEAKAYLKNRLQINHQNNPT